MFEERTINAPKPGGALRRDSKPLTPDGKPITTTAQRIIVKSKYVNNSASNTQQHPELPAQARASPTSALENRVDTPATPTTPNAPVIPTTQATPATPTIPTAPAIQTVLTRASLIPQNTLGVNSSNDWQEDYNKARDFVMKEKYDSALPLYEKVIKLHRTAKTVNHYGVALFGSTRKSETEAFFFKATQEYPLDAELQRNLGKAYEVNGKKESAVKAYEKALELGLIEPELEDYIKQIRKSLVYRV